MNNNNLKETIIWFVDEVWNAGDFSHLEDYIHPNYKVMYDPGDPWDGQFLDITQFKERVDFFRNSYPDMKFDIQEMVESSEKVAVRWTMKGSRLKKESMELFPPISITGMTFYYFKAGKLSGHRQTLDLSEVYAQINENKCINKQHASNLASPSIMQNPERAVEVC